MKSSTRLVLTCLLTFLLLAFIPLSCRVVMGQTYRQMMTKSGTSYTFTNADSGRQFTFTSGSSVAVTLPQANSSTFRAGWYVDVYVSGNGTVTITPTTSTIGGASSLALTKGQSVTITSNGTNYLVNRTDLTDAQRTALAGLASVSSTELGYLDGVTSAIQTQLDAKEVPLTFSTGLTRSTNTVTVNTSQNIAKLSNLTSNGIVTTGSGDGTLSVTSTTGSGNVVLATSPTLTTPTIGVASATTVNKVAITAPATGSTLTIPDGVTLTGPASSGTAATLGNAETFTGLKSFNDGTLKLVGGDYGSSDGSLPGSPVTGTFYRNTNASSKKVFFYDGTGFREVLLNGISGPISVANGGTGAATLTGVLKGNGTSAFTAATAGTDYVSPSSTETLTNKTLSAEGTGNVLTTVEKIWLAAGGCVNTTPASFWDLPTSTPAVAACVTGTNTQKGVLQFADTSGGFSAQTNFLLPADFTGNIDIRIVWSTSATSGNVKWSVASISTAIDASETDDPAFNSYSTVTTAVPGTANRLQTSAITSLTITGVAASELLHLKIFRDGNDGSDTAGATVNLIGVEVTLRRAQ